MCFDGFRGDAKGLGNFIVAVPKAEQSDNLLFPMRKRCPAFLHFILGQVLVQSHLCEFCNDLLFGATLLFRNLLDHSDEFLIPQKDTRGFWCVPFPRQVLQQTLKKRHAGDYIRTNVLGQAEHPVSTYQVCYCSNSKSLSSFISGL